MATFKFEMKQEDLNKIEESILEYGENSEKVINDYLNSVAKNKFMTAIKDYMPVSNRNKNHAKTSNSIDSISYNLALVIKTKSKFNYLYFPQTGEGTSKGKNPNDFMEKGINKEYDNVINGMLDRLQNRI